LVEVLVGVGGVVFLVVVVCMFTLRIFTVAIFVTTLVVGVVGVVALGVIGLRFTIHLIGWDGGGGRNRDGF
jgi:hypothetical protein